MAKRRWWPRQIAKQAEIMHNFRAKIGQHALALGLSPADVAAAEENCTAFLTAMAFVDECRMTMQSATTWRDSIFYGPETNAAPRKPPVFSVAGDPGYKPGVLPRFFALRDRILAAPGYNSAIGADLGLIGPEISPRPLSEIAPDLNLTVTNGNYIRITGSMQGMDAVRIEFARTGGNFQTVGFLTRTPGGFYLSSQNSETRDADVYSAGQLRAVFIYKNEPIGRFSPSYPVVVADR